MHYGIKNKDRIIIYIFQRFYKHPNIIYFNHLHIISTI